jgi:hypothetical protein
VVLALRTRETAQVVPDTFGGLVPPVGFLLKQTADDLREHHRDVGVDLDGRFRDPGQVVVRQAQRVPVAERWRPGGHLIERRAERVQVGPLVDRPTGPAGLLGREVGERTGDIGVMGEAGPFEGEGGR